MTTERTLQIIQQWYDDIGRGDLDAVLNRLSEDIVFELPQDDRSRIVSYLGTHRGRAAVAEAFRLRGEENEVLGYELREIVAQDRRAFAVVYTRARYRPSGVEYEIEDTHRLELDDREQIISWKVFFDPNPEVEAYLAHLPEQFIAAVRAQNAVEVRRLLEFGADPSTREEATGLTVLMIAAGQGDAPMTRTLLEAGADVLTTDRRGGATALHKACQGGSVEVARLLLEAGAFIDAAAGTTGHTALMDALWYKHPLLVQLLLDRGTGLGLSTHYGFSLQQHFEYELSVNPHDQDVLREAGRMLDDRRASDQRLVDSQELMAAVNQDETGRVRDLLDAGASIDERFPIVNGFNDHHTPLLVACRDGHGQIADLLVQHGADINAVEPTFGAVPLHKAVYNGHADITAMLVRQPGLDLNYQGATNGYTALHDALWHGYRECAEILIEAGARLDLRGHDGKRPLEVAIDLFGDADALVAVLRDRTPAA